MLGKSERSSLFWQSINDKKAKNVFCKFEHRKANKKRHKIEELKVANTELSYAMFWCLHFDFLGVGWVGKKSLYVLTLSFVLFFLQKNSAL
jgi:hypothetical protein